MSRIPPAKNIELPIHQGQGAESMNALFSVMAQRPEVARQSISLLETVMRTGTVEPQLKELLAIRVSQVNHCAY
ncbi:MAG: carboxymuconolactone decarboxylase family protein [Chloroflexota bacterium]|nr:carboxymuconolactone decarboxylase family protein [Chloroflexota bacterium]